MEHKANKGVMERIGEEGALIHAHNRKEKGNALGSPWRRLFTKNGYRKKMLGSGQEEDEDRCCCNGWCLLKV